MKHITPHEGPGSGKKPVRIKKKKKPVFHTQPVLPLALFSSTMLFVSLIYLLGGRGPMGMLKALLISGAAFIVTYSVNRLAIERGSMLGVRGYHLATISSVASILIVGAGLFLGTFSGLVLNNVEEIRQGKHLPALTASIAERNKIVLKANRASAVLQTIVLDLNQYKSCEISRNCISARQGPTGRGRVTRTLEEKANRASQIVEQFTNGEAKRQKTLANLNALITGYQKKLGQTETDIWERRTALQEIDSRINQSLSELDESIPLTLIQSYADELQNRVSIPERPLATARLNEILNGHGRALEKILSTLDKEIPMKPTFPKRTGVGDTLGFILHFAPLAAVTFLVELVFPLYLFGVTYWNLLWLAYVEDQPPENDPNNGPNGDNDLFGRLMNLPTPEEKQSAQSGRQS